MMTSSAEAYAAALSVVVVRCSALARPRLRQDALYLIILNGADELVELFRLFRRSRDGCDLVVLRQQNRQTQADITYACNSDFHGLPPYNAR